MIYVKCSALMCAEGCGEKTVIAIDGARITALLAERDIPPGANVHDYPGATAGPGLIDIHCHGAAGSDFSDGTVEDVCAAAAHHLSRGVTTLLATVASCSPTDTLRALDSIRRSRPLAPSVWGAHLEGPYFSKSWPGCHLPDLLRDPSDHESAALREYLDCIRHVTIAPEIPGALTFIREFAARGVRCSIGHSDASLAIIREAIDAGLTHSTHIFNAMPRARRVGMVLEPGVLESVLLLDSLTTEIVGDAIHVGPSLVELVWRVKGATRAALISDALRGVGAGPGDYAFGPRDGQMCRILSEPMVGVVPGSVPLRLASSAITLSDSIRILRGQTSIPLAQLWEMASLTPARILGIDSRVGALRPGLEADILVLDKDLNVAAVYKHGVKGA